MINNCYLMHNFIWRNFYYIKFLIEKCSFSTFYWVSKNTKAHFSQKAKLLGFHWTSFWIPHGYPYQEIQFWFESHFKGLDPSRAELWGWIRLGSGFNIFLIDFQKFQWLKYGAEKGQINDASCFSQLLMRIGINRVNENKF